MATNPRDNFPKPVADALAKRASYICSNPDCRAHTIAPSEGSDTKSIYIGKAAHIRAARSGGPWYDPTMTSTERKAAANGIFLCSNCADMIDKNNGLGFSVEVLLFWKQLHNKWVSDNLNKRGNHRGGAGGDADAADGGAAIGGVGGDAGHLGDGGRGGNAIAKGTISLAIGGPGGRGGVGPGMNGMDTKKSIGDIIIGGGGGDAPRPDGRGGRGGRSGRQLLGLDQQDRLPDGRYPGEGGRGANSPSYDGKATTIKSLLREYYNNVPTEVSYADKHSAVPLDWLNASLVNMGTAWRVQLDDNEFEIIDAALADSEPYYNLLCRHIMAASEMPSEQVPKGVALVACQDFRLEQTFPHSLTNIANAWKSHVFPVLLSPFAIYILISGAATVELSLSLLADNDESLWEQKFIADNWGEIGAYSRIEVVNGLKLPRPGIYRWRLSHANKLLLEYPIVCHQIDKPIVSDIPPQAQP